MHRRLTHLLFQQGGPRLLLEDFLLAIVGDNISIVAT